MNFTTRYILWTMDDLTYDILKSLSKRHLKLAVEAIDPSTTRQRKDAIQSEINGLRLERDTIIEQQRQLLIDSQSN